MRVINIRPSRVSETKVLYGDSGTVLVIDNDGRGSMPAM